MQRAEDRVDINSTQAFRYHGTLSSSWEVFVRIDFRLPSGGRGPIGLSPPGSSLSFHHSATGLSRRTGSRYRTQPDRVEQSEGWTFGGLQAIASALPGD